MDLTIAITTNKKDIINAVNSRDSLKRQKNKELTINGIVIFKDGDKEVSVIKTVDNKFYSSVSQSVKDTLITICTLFTEEEITRGIQIKVNEKVSRNDRNYLVIELI